MNAVPARDLAGLLVAVVYPLWLLAGIADVLVHRRDRIEMQAGAHESALHVILCVQMGLAVVLVVAFDVNAPVLLAVAALVLLHAWTSWRDTRLADRVRHIGPLEQKLHVALDAIPWLALVLVALMHADMVRDLLHGRAHDWSVHARMPWPMPGLIAFLAASFVFGLLPSLLEWRRAKRFVRAAA